jgi:hypothetical protein
MAEDGRRRTERLAEARRRWWPGDPAPSPAPAFPSGSLGDRLLSESLFASMLEMPSLAQATVPDAEAIRADPAQWTIAAWVLARAVVLDGLAIGDPAVASLLEVLAPVAQAELAVHAGTATLAGAGDTGRLGANAFDDDGPMLVIGTFCLIHATWAAIGDDPIAGVLEELARALEGPLPGRGQVVAEALVRAFATHYRCEQEGDLALLERIGGPGEGDGLLDLVASGAVTPDEALGVGLAALGALTTACLSPEASLLAGAGAGGA